MSTPLLSIENLRVEYRANGPVIRALRGIDLQIAAGECVGVVGESGSGKSQLLLSILGLLPRSARISGNVIFDGLQLVGAPDASLNRIRGARIGMAFQDPMSALNPYLKIGSQLIETLRRHRGLGTRAATDRARHLLDAVQIADPAQRLRQYPHELSGGMRQRVLLAMALCCDPQLLLCDEPTTALDVSVQAQILQLLRELRLRTGVAILLVTHDLGVVAQLADRVCVMYAGRIVEQAPLLELQARCRHPYTEGLRQADLRLDQPLPVRLAAIEGSPPDPAALPDGCAFAPRCMYRQPKCLTTDPPLIEEARYHWRACFHQGTLGALPQADR